MDDESPPDAGARSAALIAQLHAENARLHSRLEALSAPLEGSVTDLFSVDPALALELLDQGIIIHRVSDDAVVYANPAARQLLGSGLLRVGTPSAGAAPALLDERGEAIPSDRHPVLKALRHGATVDRQIVGLWRQAHHDYVWLRLCARRVEDDRVLEPLVLVSFTDITAQLDAERSLLEAEDSLELTEALLREAGAMARFGGWLLDVATGVLTWTDGVYAIYGLEPGTPIHLSETLTHYPPDAQSRLHESLARCIRRGASYDLELPLRDRHGAQRWVRTIGTPVVRGGRVVQVRGVCQDITSQRLAEEARRRLESRLQAMAKIESLEVMAAGVAHDIKNHLTTFQLGTMAALEELEPVHPAYGLIESLIKAARHAEGLPRQLMDYARKSTITEEPVDLTALISKMISLLEATVRGRATICFDLPGAPAVVMGDARQLQQAIVNLILNAAESMETRGRITLSLVMQEMPLAALEQIRLDHTLPAGTYVLLSVTDQGCGISPEVRDRIFDPFFTTKSSGNGLGLASVLGTARTHGGFIDVHSARGEGTTMTLGLPRWSMA